MDILVPALVLFVTTIALIELFRYVNRILRDPNRQKIKRRLKTISSKLSAESRSDITRQRVLSSVPTLNKILIRSPGISQLDRMLRQGNVQSPLGVFILLSLVLMFFGFIGAFWIFKSTVVSLFLSLALGSIPYFYVWLKKNKRAKKFERQLPDGLELIARALRAGHAFTTGLKLAADEFDDPLGTEFTEALDEVNFGVSMTDALKNLTGRIDCPDLKFFVVSVILQRETGGNLAEIIESIAHIIRERYKIRGKIRTLSAEGRLTAIILVLIPFYIIISVRVVSPAYFDTLLTEPAGKKMAMAGALMMLFGILLIRKMIKIKI